MKKTTANVAFDAWSELAEFFWWSCAFAVLFSATGCIINGAAFPKCLTSHCFHLAWVMSHWFWEIIKYRICPKASLQCVVWNTKSQSYTSLSLYSSNFSSLSTQWGETIKCQTSYKSKFLFAKMYLDYRLIDFRNSEILFSQKALTVKLTWTSEH